MVLPAFLLFYLASAVTPISVADFVNRENETESYGDIIHQMLERLVPLRGAFDLVVVLPGGPTEDLLPFMTDPLTCLSCADDHDSELNMLDTRRSRSVTVLFCDLETNVKFLLKTTNRTSHHWLIYGGNDGIEDVVHYEPFSEFLINSFLVVSTSNGNGSLDFYNVYTIDHGNGPIVQKTSSDELFYQHEFDRANLGGLNLRLTAVFPKTYNFDTNLYEDSKGDLHLNNSFALSKFAALQHAMNFSISVKLAQTWGSLDKKTNEWSGMVGDVVNGEANMSATHASDTAKRRQAVDYTLPTATWKLCAYFRKPQNSVALLQPFKKSLWFALLVWVFTISFVAMIFRYVLYRWNLGGKQAEFVLLDIIPSSPPSADSHGLWGVLDSLLWAIGIMCTQGFHYVPDHSCYRILDLTGHLAAFIVQIAYGGVLISFLSVTLKDSISTFDQLVDNSYTLAIDGNPLWLQLLEDTPLFQNPESAKKLQILYGNVRGLASYKDDILAGNFAFITEDAPAYYSLKNDFRDTDAAVMGDVCMKFGYNGLGSIVPKNWPFKRLFDYQIIRFRELGIVKAWLRRYWPKRMTYDGPSFESVDLTSVSTAFVIYLMGCALSLSILFAEVVTHSRRIRNFTVKARQFLRSHQKPAIRISK